MVQKNDKQEAFELAKHIMAEDSWFAARYVFTAICLMGDVYADTAECDDMLYELWQCVDDDVEYGGFKEFMLGLIA